MRVRDGLSFTSNENSTSSCSAPGRGGRHPRCTPSSKKPLARQLHPEFDLAAPVVEEALGRGQVLEGRPDRRRPVHGSGSCWSGSARPAAADQSRRATRWAAPWPPADGLAGAARRRGVGRACAVARRGRARGARWRRGSGRAVRGGTARSGRAARDGAAGADFAARDGAVDSPGSAVARRWLRRRRREAGSRAARPGSQGREFRRDVGRPVPAESVTCCGRPCRGATRGRPDRGRQVWSVLRAGPALRPRGPGSSPWPSSPLV